MGQRKNMLFLIAILTALLAIYVGLKVWNQNSEEREAKKAEDEIISIIEDDDLTEIYYTDGQSEMKFIKEDNVWLYENDKEIPMSQDAVEGIVNTVTELTAVRELEDPDELADYGLTEPSYTIAYVADDDENVIYVGDMAGENYYLTVNDTGKVYTVSEGLVSALLFDLAEVAEYDDVPTIGSGNLVSVVVTENGKRTTYTEEEDLAQLAGGFGALELETCVDYHVAEEALADYGLDEDSCITAVAAYKDSETEENEEFVVYIGDVTDDMYQYVMVEGSQMVYQVSHSVVENMIVVSEEEKGEE